MQLENLKPNQCFIEWANATFTSLIGHDKFRKEFYKWLSVKKKNVSRELVSLGLEDSHHHYYDPIRMVISRGHIKYAFTFAKENGYEIIVGDNLKSIIEHRPHYDGGEFINKLSIWGGEKYYKFYDYQENFINWALENRTGVGLSATGSGKTLITYGIIRYLLNEHSKTKILMIVPSTTLVKQGFKDFAQYSEKDVGWNVEEEVWVNHGSSKDVELQNCIIKFENETLEVTSNHTFKKDKGAGLLRAGTLKRGDVTKLHGKVIKVTKTEKSYVLITTWQSLKNKSKKFYEQFNHVIVDEVHGADAAVLKKSIEKCKNAYTKIGMTGSLKGSGGSIDKNNRMVLEGLFGGRIETFSTTRELINRGILPDLKILKVNLQYSSRWNKKLMDSSEVDTRKKLSVQDKLKQYQEEKKFLKTIKPRNDYVYDLIDSLKGSTVVFFTSVEYAKEMKENYKGPKEAHFIDGTVCTAERDRILYDRINESGVDCVLFSTFGTTATGISVNTLNAAIMCDNMKSRIKVLQSIGRLLRGDKALVIDLADKFRSDNYLWRHANDRTRLYNSVDYYFTEKDVRIP